MKRTKWTHATFVVEWGLALVVNPAATYSNEASFIPNRPQKNTVDKVIK